jgi:Na+-driven multidrug efflux pump
MKITASWLTQMFCACFEVVSWTLLGVVWKVVEACTDGIGEASAVRDAYHLGTGNPKKARLSSYKAVFISVVQSLFVTSILYIIGNNLATWLTTDLTLQLIFKNALTIFGLGNIVMSYRMILWSLVGAQDRYRLATLVVILSRWLVAIPFAAAFVYSLTLDLNGVIASIIVGTKTASTALAYVVLRSDWERLSCIMQDTSSSIVDMDSHEERENTESDRR